MNRVPTSRWNPSNPFLPTFALIVASSVLIAPRAFADEFKIGIKAELGNRQFQTDRTEESPSSKPVPRRPVLELSRDETVQVSWRAENVSRSDEFKEVTIHFFVVAEKDLGQPQIPKLGEGVVHEGALSMDFKPREKANWRLTLKIPEAGNYLLRVETIGMALKQGHEYYTALDLAVK
jgi:hypothetical protein